MARSGLWISRIAISDSVVSEIGSHTGSEWCPVEIVGEVESTTATVGQVGLQMVTVVKSVGWPEVTTGPVG